MSLVVSFRVAGFKELNEMFLKLPEDMNRRVLAAAFRKAAKPTIQVMHRLARRSAAPRIKGLHMADTIRVYDNKKNRPMAGRRGVELAIGPAASHFHSTFVEFGTRKMPAYPFARPAWTSTQSQVFYGMKDEMWAGILRSAARARRQAIKWEQGSLPTSKVALLSIK